MAKQWHTEEDETEYPGQRFQLEENELIYETKSQYQTIRVFDHVKFGRVLSLDGCVQGSTFDEFLYQEMLTYLPLCSTEDVSKVLVLGGGDGGVAREAVKDPRVKSVVVVDIDEKVVETCRKFIPSMAASFDNPKVTLVIENAKTYLKNQPDNSFNAVILDLTDSPAREEDSEPAFINSDLMRDIRRVLVDGGVLSQQDFAPYSNNILLAKSVGVFKAATTNICYGSVPVPCFPNGAIGICFGRVWKNGQDHIDLSCPVWKISEDCAVKMGLRCYYDVYHTASCTLPLDFKIWWRELAEKGEKD